MTNPALSNQSIRALKSQAHALKPVVRVGQHGVTDAVLAELEIALDHHELLKIKVGIGDRDARDTIIADLATRTNSTVIQRIGNIAVLYRQKPEQKKKAKKRSSSAKR